MIKVRDFFGESGDFQKGFALFQAIQDRLAHGTPVEIDFSDAGGVSSSFLHGFLAESFNLVGIDAAKRLLMLRNVSRGQADMLKKYIADYNHLGSSATPTA